MEATGLRGGAATKDLLFLISETCPLSKSPSSDSEMIKDPYCEVNKNLVSLPSSHCLLQQLEDLRGFELIRLQPFKPYGFWMVITVPSMLSRSGSWLALPSYVLPVSVTLLIV